MKFFLLEKKDDSELMDFIDFKDNIERLRKIRSLNIKDLGRIRNSGIKIQGKDSARARSY